MKNENNQLKQTELGSIPEDWEILKLFHSKAKELKSNNNEFLQNLKLSISLNETSTLEKRIPNKKIIESVVLELRPFVLSDESLFFTKVCNQIIKSVDLDETTKKKVQDTRKAWNEIFDNSHKNNPVGGIGFCLDGKEIKQGELFKVWINAKYYHPSDIKSENYQIHKTLKSWIYYDVLELSFIDTIQRMVQLIFWFDVNIVCKLINETN